MRKIRNAVALAISTLALVALGAAPAQAGTGASQACNNGFGYQELLLPGGNVTIGAELGFDPTTNTANWLIVCFSNTVPGVPSTITGGALYVFFGYYNDGSVNYHADLYCDDDLGSQTIDLVNPPFSHCDYDNNVRITIGTTPVTGPIPCPVSVLGNCLPTVPGVSLPIPTISLTVANVRIL